MDITKRYPNKESIISTFDACGVDPGEVVSAAFCNLDPTKRNEASNLLVKRSALYQPTFGYRDELEQLTARRIVVSPEDLKPSVWAHRDDRIPEQPGHVVEVVEIPSISEVVQSLQPSSFKSVEQHVEGLKRFAYAFDALTSFYGSNPQKKLDWDRQRAIRSEMDLAVDGALRTMDKEGGTHARARRPTLIVYGNGEFKTRTSLSSLHSSFKGYFHIKATGLGFQVVSADEYLTSTKCPGCVARGINLRM
ncbi:hypothetical protein BGZ65_011909, partial [Modicella reniformis]